MEKEIEQLLDEAMEKINKVRGYNPLDYTMNQDLCREVVRTAILEAMRVQREHDAKR
jgi:hypothetical protein